MNSEHAEQVTLINEFKKRYPNEIIFAIPNGDFRHKQVARRLKAEGVLSGVSDICVITKDKTLWIEMKRKRKILKNGKQSKEDLASKEQHDFINYINQTTHSIGFIAYGWEDAISFIENHIN